MNNDAPSPMFFILGRGRSGTTLLSRMLDRHSAVAVAPEGFFAMNLWRRYGCAPFTSMQVDAFRRDLLQENRMKTWNLNVTDVAARLRSALDSSEHHALDYSHVCTLVYESYAHATLGKASVERFGDKNPHYALLAQRLLTTFPHARFLHVVRDPRDNVMSYKSVPFDVNHTSTLAYRWRAYNQRLLAAQAAAPERFLRVRYEDLVEQPESVLSQICAHLDLEYEADMMTFFEQRPSGFYGKDSPWFDHLKRPLDPGQADKWHAAVDKSEIAVIEAICGPLLEEFDYRRSGTPNLNTQLRAAVGAMTGAFSVAAEDLIFDALPTGFRIKLINRYRKQSGRV